MEGRLQRQPAQLMAKPWENRIPHPTNPRPEASAGRPASAAPSGWRPAQRAAQRGARGALRGPGPEAEAESISHGFKRTGYIGG